MSNHQVLDNITHKDLRVAKAISTQFEASQSHSRVFLSELRDVQSEYPIFFQKDSSSGEFQLIALFGFDQDENMFMDDKTWNAQYIPLAIQRRPFLIGFQEQHLQGQLVNEPVVFVDMDSKRINPPANIESETVFLAQGGQSPYLEHINSILATIHEGHQALPSFIQALNNLALIEPVSIKVELADGSHRELNSLYTIAEETLSKLNGNDLLSLHANGYLQAVYMCIASISNLSKLIDAKNKQLTTE